MDQQLLRQLYLQYHKELYLYLYSLCRDRALTEDLLQETFLKALLALPDGHPNLRAWLYMVARNLYFNERKHSARMILQEEVAPPGPPAPDVLEHMITDERHRALWRAMEGLDERKREILQMQYFGGLAQREIAAVLHLKPEYVRVLASRARKELKQKLEENGYDIS